MEDANEYMRRAQALADKSPCDVGERRRLRLELQKRFGLLEIEAINILNGCHIGNYVDKYYRMKNEIVLPVIDTSDFQMWLNNEIARQDFAANKDDGWSIKDD